MTVPTQLNPKDVADLLALGRAVLFDVRDPDEFARRHVKGARLRPLASLGAAPLTAFFRVTLPLIAPGVSSGALFAFATSFDEVVVTLFLAGPAQITLPRQMFSGIRENLSPTIAAAATLLIGFSIALLLTLEWLRGRAEKLRTQQPA